jgi:hypothetical protein
VLAGLTHRVPSFDDRAAPAATRRRRRGRRLKILENIESVLATAVILPLPDRYVK